MFLTEINVSDYEDHFSFRFYFNEEIDNNSFLDLVKKWILESNTTICTDFIDVNLIPQKHILKLAFFNSEYLDLNSFKSEDLLPILKEIFNEKDFDSLLLDVEDLENNFSDEKYSNFINDIRFDNIDLIMEFFNLDCCVSFLEWLEDNCYGENEKQSDTFINFSLN